MGPVPRHRSGHSHKSPLGLQPQWLPVPCAAIGSVSAIAPVLGIPLGVLCTMATATSYHPKSKTQTVNAGHRCGKTCPRKRISFFPRLSKLHSKCGLSTCAVGATCLESQGPGKDAACACACARMVVCLRRAASSAPEQRAVRKNATAGAVCLFFLLLLLSLLLYLPLLLLLLLLLTLLLLLF